LAELGHELRQPEAGQPLDKLGAIRRACAGWSVAGEVAMNESATRTRLEVFLEFPGSGFILESAVPRKDPWGMEAGIPAISPSMLGEATFQVFREAGVESRRVFLAAKDVNVKHGLLAFARTWLRHSSSSDGELRRSCAIARGASDGEAPAVGLEPTTNRLTADRSTTELRWNMLSEKQGGTYRADGEVRQLLFCSAIRPVSRMG
jgi:hypothetical protein